MVDSRVKCIELIDIITAVFHAKPDYLLKHRGFSRKTTLLSVLTLKLSNLQLQTPQLYREIL